MLIFFFYQVGASNNAASDDNEADQRRPSNPGVSPNIETTLDDELEQSDALPPRVLVFTTLKLLGFLTMCKRGSVDGTFKAITRFWQQLFILMVEYRGIHLPVAFAWLPNKTAVSYYVFLWLLLNAFTENSSQISQLYGKSTLRLRQLKCDFEVSIHIGFEMFRLSGCYFHFTQVIDILYCLLITYKNVRLSGGKFRIWVSSLRTCRKETLESSCGW